MHSWELYPAQSQSLQETNSSAPRELNGLMMAGLAMLMGVILSSLLRFFQWQSLRQYLPNARGWIPINAIAWAVGCQLLLQVQGVFLPKRLC